MLATPVDFDGRPPAPRWRAPLLGEHSREVLREYGTRRRRALRPSYPTGSRSPLLLVDEGLDGQGDLRVCSYCSVDLRLHHLIGVEPSPPTRHRYPPRIAVRRARGFGWRSNCAGDEMNGNITESSYSIGWTNPLATAWGPTATRAASASRPIAQTASRVPPCLVEGGGGNVRLRARQRLRRCGPPRRPGCEPWIDPQVLAADGEQARRPVRSR